MLSSKRQHFLSDNWHFPFSGHPCSLAVEMGNVRAVVKGLKEGKEAPLEFEISRERDGSAEMGHLF